MNGSRVPGIPAYHVMLKPRGAVCNLDCAYCYYLEKEGLYPGSDFRMSEGLLESFTRQYIESQSAPEVVFGWQGGEPTLMGLEFFRRAVELQERHRPPGVRILNTLQTNGTRLDEAWCRFFAEHGFLVGISIDGPEDVHDAYRVDKGGHPTHEAVMAGLRLLRQHQVEFNVLTTVHSANAHRPLDVYRFIRDEVGSRFVQFIPIVEKLGASGDAAEAGVTEHSVGARAYGAFLSAIFDEWVRRDVGRMFVQTFDVTLAAWVGQPPGLCIFAETCGTALAMEHNGDLYSCDHFVEPRHRVGNVLERPIGELVGSDRQREFGVEKQTTLPAYCRACEVRFACNGGCPKNRFVRTPDGETGLNYLCEGYRAFFNHVAPAMRFMADSLLQGRAPADIMRGPLEGG